MKTKRVYNLAEQAVIAAADRSYARSRTFKDEVRRTFTANEALRAWEGIHEEREGQRAREADKNRRAELMAMTKVELVEYVYEIAQALGEDGRVLDLEKLAEDVKDEADKVKGLKDRIQELENDLGTSELKLDQAVANVSHEPFCFAFGENPRFFTCTCGRAA